MSTKIVKKRLPDMLLEQGLVTREQLQECMNIQRATGQSLPTLLVAETCISETWLSPSRTRHPAHPRHALSIPKEGPRRGARDPRPPVPNPPVSVTGEVLVLAMADPLNIMALDDLRMLTAYDIEPVVAITCRAT